MHSFFKNTYLILLQQSFQPRLPAGGTIHIAANTAGSLGNVTVIGSGRAFLYGDSALNCSAYFPLGPFEAAQGSVPRQKRSSFTQLQLLNGSVVINSGSNTQIDAIVTAQDAVTLSNPYSMKQFTRWTGALPPPIYPSNHTAVPTSNPTPHPTYFPSYFVTSGNNVSLPANGLLQPGAAYPMFGRNAYHTHNTPFRRSSLSASSNIRWYDCTFNVISFVLLPVCLLGFLLLH